MIKNLFIVGLFLTVASSCAFANIDKTYTTPQTWGQWVKGLFGLTNYNKSYALVIGISSYDDPTLEDLGTGNDPLRVAQYLHKEAKFDHVRLITGSEVNLKKIQYLMRDEYRRKLGENDRFLFYWSGHGVTDYNPRTNQSVGYLPVYNSKSNEYSSMLNMRSLSEWDSSLNAKQTFYLLDSCFSGMAGFKVKSNGHKKQTLERISRKSRQVLTAGLPNEETLVIKDLGGSVFTAALLAGWRGQADTEKGSFSKDGIITARELELYIQERVDKERLRVGWPHKISPLLHRIEARPGDFFFVTERTLALAPNTSPIKIASRLASGVTTMSRREEIEALFKPEKMSCNQLGETSRKIQYFLNRNHNKLQKNKEFRRLEILNKRWRETTDYYEKKIAC